MNSKFKITIPEPCHENWNTMTPKEKGRFCVSCSKTVVDFTKKSTKEIQDYLLENSTQKTCGHFYKKQLDSITIEIPQITFNQQLSFQKMFILSLLFVMGTTLFSCQFSDGKKRKIENVVILDTVNKIEKKIDSFTVLNSENPAIKAIPFCPTKKIDTIYDEELEGLIILGGVKSEIELQEEIGFIVIEKTPRFKESKKLSKTAAKKDFHKRIRDLVVTNFDKELINNLGLSIGKHKIYVHFIINEEGNVIDIKTRAPHRKIEKEVRKILKKLPQFIPGKQNGEVVKTKYSLPITFVVD